MITPPLPGMNDKQREFLKTVAGLALDTERETGIPASITLAQAVLESAGKVMGEWQWGGSELFRLANNPFGIKFTRRAEAKGYKPYEAPTHEYEHGELKPEHDQFVRYSSLIAAFEDHADLIRALYAPAMLVRRDPEKFANAIMLGGYSTDRPTLCKTPGCPHYAGKLMSLVRQHKLDNYGVLCELAGRPIVPVSDPEIGL